MEVSMDEWNSSATLKELIRALCADYERRRACLEKESVSRRVRMEYAFINTKIADAAAEICGEALADVFIKEIGDGIGYAGSAVSWLAESTYKKYKSDVMRNVAAKLHLYDFKKFSAGDIV